MVELINSIQTWPQAFVVVGITVSIVTGVVIVLCVAYKCIRG